MTQWDTCPECQGTGRCAPAEAARRYVKVIAGYDVDTDTMPCHNCGGQYQMGQPTGQVRLNAQGQACGHRYVSVLVGRCLTRYTCTQCGDSHTIDSGD